MRVIALVVLAAVWCNPVRAQSGDADLVEYAVDADGNSHSYYLSSTRFLGGGRVTLWTHTRLIKPVPLDPNKKGGERVSTSKQHAQIDCRAETLGHDSISYHGAAKASPIYSWRDPNPSMNPVAPDTVGSALLKLICSDSRAQR